MSLTPSGLPAVQDEEKTFAMIAHLCAFVVPIVGPGVIWLLKKDTSPFIAYHAVQAALFQLVVWMVPAVATTVLSIVTFGMCGWLGCLMYFAVFGAIPWALKAKNGEWTGYPGLAQFGLPTGS